MSVLLPNLILAICIPLLISLYTGSKYYIFMNYFHGLLFLPVFSLPSTFYKMFLVNITFIHWILILLKIIFYSIVKKQNISIISQLINSSWLVSLTPDSSCIKGVFVMIMCGKTDVFCKGLVSWLKQISIYYVPLFFVRVLMSHNNWKGNQMWDTASKKSWGIDK